ncbi:MAG: ParB/RepB/Spo0J family partition protein [Syntrophales bacterium]
MTTYASNQLHMVPLAELQPDPAQPRKYVDPLALEELTASVSQVGIIEPVVCRQDPQTGLVYVVAGERRCAAARQAGLTSVPAVFIAGDNHAEIALVENLLRQDLNAVEEAEALQRLMDEHAYPQEQLARIIGKSQATISLSLSLNKLPREIRDECRQDPAVSRNVLVTIARKKQDRSMVTAFKKYRDQQAKLAARQAGTLTSRKRTKAETLTSQIDAMKDKISGLELLSLAKTDREMVMEAMTSLQNAMNEAFNRAAQ